MAQMTQLPVAYTPVREVLQPSNEGLLSWLDAICPLDLRFVRMVPIPTAGGPPGCWLVPAFFTFLSGRRGTVGRARSACQARQNLTGLQRYDPEMERRRRKRLKSHEEQLTEWTRPTCAPRTSGAFLCQALDSSGATLDFLRSAKQDSGGPQGAFKAKVLSREHHAAPRVIHTKGYAAYPIVARAAGKRQAFYPRTGSIDRCAAESSPVRNKLSGLTLPRHVVSGRLGIP
jgi:hypothetical protein